MAFYEHAETMRTLGDACHQSVEPDQHKPCAECGEEGRSAIDRARKHGCENETEHGVKCGESGHEPLICEPDHSDGCDKDDNGPKHYLQKAQVQRFSTQAQ